MVGRPLCASKVETHGCRFHTDRESDRRSATAEAEAALSLDSVSPIALSEARLVRNGAHRLLRPADCHYAAADLSSPPDGTGSKCKAGLKMVRDDVSADARHDKEPARIRLTRP